ncbi:MAG: hypothetical protein DRJ97_06410 [Thermoprotei archaeon]|nr:MAG: hypothetical protein DRJ97_06410 [Thermoprotei archaeon]
MMEALEVYGARRPPIPVVLGPPLLAAVAPLVAVVLLFSLLGLWWLGLPIAIALALALNPLKLTCAPIKGRVEVKGCGGSYSITPGEVAEVAVKLGIKRLPPLFLAPSAEVNGFTTPFGVCLNVGAVASGLWRGVLAHELAHYKLRHHMLCLALTAVGLIGLALMDTYGALLVLATLTLYVLTARRLEAKADVEASRAGFAEELAAMVSRAKPDLLHPHPKHRLELIRRYAERP